INHNVTPDGGFPADCQDGDEQDFVKLDTGFGVESGLPNGLSEPRVLDTDGNGTADYAYAGDLQGNLFRFDITASDFNDWSVTKIFKAQYKPGTVDEKNQPITAQPIAIVHPTEEEGFIIIFGTGAYVRTVDSTDSEIQSVYGLWDRLGPELILKSDLQVQSYTNVDDTLGKLRTLTDNDVDYSVSAIGAQKGWYNDLDSPAAGAAAGAPAEFPGEKAVRNIQLRGGISFVNSVFPREIGSCVDRAGGAALSFCPDTGGSLCFNQTVFDLNNDGIFDAGDDIGGARTAAGIIFEDPAPPTDSTFIGDKRVTQYGRALHIIGTNTSFGAIQGRLSWKRLETIN
ncbi:MAG: PilC/PilY family type IV pilus protein, partial [Pseudomonadales bacterium]|nr:PilC/PilY family type IV pilus protein [Pseudomonadales bacterium]